MKKFKFLIVLFGLIVFIAFGFYINSAKAVGPCYDDKSIDLSVDPSSATTTINISGTVSGDSTEEGVCGGACGATPFIVVYQINTLEYRIDSGAWVSLGYGSDWWVTITGFNTDCSAGVCGEEQTYQYDYQKNNIDVSGLSDGGHTVTVRATGGHCPSESITRSETFTKTTACDCSGVGWQDPLWWGGCGDCNLNSTNNCEPCGEALAYCDGCNWDNRWDPFRDEAYTGTGPGHKCPGNPKICTPNSDWCDGQYAWHCSSEGCSKWSENCGSDYWTNEYRCSGTMVQRKYVSRGCNNGACYSNDIWYDWEQCNNYDGCYAYGTGCENRDYYCSAGSCTYSVSNRNTDYYDAYVNYCSGTTVRKHQLFHDFYCDGGNCSDHTSWQNDQLVQDCGPDNCSDSGSSWFSKEYVDDNESCSNGACVADQRHWDYCDGNINHDRQCSGPDLGADSTKNCNDFDGMYDSVYRDYSCSDGACVYSSNTKPNTPTLIAPPHNTWINYNPTFQAQVSDPDGENVRAYFNVSGYGDGWGNWVGSPGTSSWGPVGMASCVSYWWRAYAQDARGLTSSWTGYWLVKVDKDSPSPGISYPSGTIDYTTFTVSLTESDACSGIAEGDVDISINNGAWQNYASTIDNFNFTGSNNTSYKFRYRARDNANNWSGFVEGPLVTIKLNQAPNIPTLIAPPHNTWINYNPTFQAQVSDPDNDRVEAEFSIIGYGNGGLGDGLVNSGNTDSWGPVNLGTCFQNWWNARARDEHLLFGNWSGSWYVKVDKDAPSVGISYPTGTICSTTISPIIITESDNCSGIYQGEGQVSINNGAWQNWPTSSEYNGSVGSCYKFRYRARDAANNWSNWAEGGTVCIEATPTVDIKANSSDGPISIAYNTSATLSWTSTRATGCTASGDWSGSKPTSGSESTGNLTSNKTYTLTCSNVCGLRSDSVTVNVGAAPNNPPNTPTLIAPPHNTWINYNPTFQAQVSDPDNDRVEAEFSIIGYGNGGLGDGLVNSGNTDSWGPVNLGTCFQNWWNARARDEHLLFGNWSGSWYVKVDKDAPSPGISYPSGTIDYTTFTVSLTESDTCSGIAEGDVDISINNGAWQNYASTINDFSYTGIDGYQYQFRYRTKDNAGNWSNFTEGGTVTIKLNKPPTATNPSLVRSDPCHFPLFYSFTWTYSDPDNDDESRFDFQVDNNSNFSSPEVNRSYTNLSNPSPSQNGQAVIVYSNPAPDSLLYNTTYYWRVMVYDTKGADSGWTNGPLFTTPPNPYPIPDFTWLPNRPATEEEVQFTDKTTTLGGATITIWSWTFQDANPAISNQQHPKIIFTSPGQKSVTLRVTDSNNNTCDKTKTVRVNYPLPKWKEVKP